MPCTYWNEATQTGTWDWTQVDVFAQAAFGIGAEPFFALSWPRSSGMEDYIPPGMAINPATGLPYPDSYAAYAREWVRHFKQKGWPVRFYEIGNEPWVYFGWNVTDYTKLQNYIDFFNAAAMAMRAENPNLLLSNDAIYQSRVVDYWLQHGDDVDFIDFHKYDANIIGEYTEQEMFVRAETRHWNTALSARQKWLNARGKELPIVLSETNYNSAWQGGTDSTIYNMAGAMWLALMLRTAILSAVSYTISYEFTGPGEKGFGMINDANNQPWYTYYVSRMIGGNLAVGDSILEADSTSENVRVIAWNHHGKLNIILICKATSQETVNLQGITGQLDATWIDNTIPYTNPQLQAATLNAENSIVLNGYTLMLLQQAMPMSLATILMLIISGLYFVTR